MSVFGRRLKELRDELGETQEDIAKLLGKSAGAVSKYEMGNRQPALEDIANLAKYFNTTSDYMLGLSNVRMNVNNIASNIEIIKGEKSIDQFIKDILKKSGYAIEKSDMVSYLRGTAIPTVEALQALADYAGVEPKYFLAYPDRAVKNKYVCKEMEELEKYQHVPFFKRVLQLAINILRNNLDVVPFEKFVESMVQLKDGIMAAEKK